MHENTAPSASLFRTGTDDDALRSDAPSIPPQTLARWAALASGLAYPGFLPRQADSRL